MFFETLSGSLHFSGSAILPTQVYVRGGMSAIWYNELGSLVKITHSADGELGGVSMNHAPDSSVKSEKLVGSMGKGLPASLGFVVNFEDGIHTTAWSRRYRQWSGNFDMATWLMTANLENSSQYWESTNVGQDRLTRTPEKLGGRKSLVAKHAK